MQRLAGFVYPRKAASACVRVCVCVCACVCVLKGWRDVMFCGVSRHVLECWCVLLEGKFWARERPSEDNVVVPLSTCFTPTLEK